MNDFETTGSGILYVIPQDPETRNDLLAIDRQTKEKLRIKHHLYLNSDWECNTITLSVLEMLANALHSHIKDSGVGVLDKNHGNVIDFYGLINVTASNRKNSQAEKNGNINIVFKKGEAVDAIISDDGLNLDDEYIAMDAACTIQDDPEFTNAMIKIDRMARKELNDKNSIMLPKNFMAVITAKTFLEILFRHLTQKIVPDNVSKASINFNDIVEIHATKKDGGVIVSLTPGMGSKLIIKSDLSTEVEAE